MRNSANSAQLCAKILLLLLLSLSASAQRPLLPVPAQATWQAGHYRFATAPLLALRRHITGPATSADESYRLRVTAAGASLTAVSPLGIQRGLATFRQVLESTPRGWRAQLCDIQDRPRFAWRGLLIDPARHFLPVAIIKRNLDGMAAVKLNVLHWHLSDDQGWRVESRLFPRLHTVAGATGYYTQAEVREVVRYAGRLGIRVVPEFDLPGHTGALLAAYPRLGSNDSIKAVPTRWGTSQNWALLDPTREGTYTMLDSVLTEMSGLFPDPYFHIGGDENDGRQWRRSPRIVAFMKAKGFVNAKGNGDKHQLQNYFNRRMLSILQKLGKTMVGWDEILGPGLPTPIIVETWRGPKGVLDAVRQGHPALRAHGYYLDLNYSAASHYAADPLQGVPDSLAGRVLGGEAAMWSEFADSVIYDSRVWPRAAAVAERLWSPAALSQDVPDMYRRLAFVSTELEALGLRHRHAPAALLAQLAAPYPAALPALQTLAGLLEPVKEYKRHFQGLIYTTETPLTRLVDAAPAESDAARRFGATADSLLASLRIGMPTFPAVPPVLSAAAKRQLASLQSQIAGWQRAIEQLPPLLVLSPSLAEYAPLAAQLGVVVSLLDQRLAQLTQGQPLLPPWQAAAKGQLDAAQKPAGQAELAIISAARRLVGL
ncbi:family 20 glycosylhydrolase [Hymenobacter sp. H14-R3]|uniref:beta-N-acetylhexosaminidase n=1 Tax=Hymenobacter sp. H14-R3 TaxID=3046308 RepID=UPI0024BB1EE0|nr:family 20 glycosylhydrolase [Hymenobacter sp. H14-R3]MDJ0365077.1 family 20 glycosylhydrolase [Hymenobacter sp. H14-R3]